jgi:hypothetical protein
MITRFFSRGALHEHAEPGQRAQAVGELPPESDELKALLTGDPAPEVRMAAAQRCTDLTVLAFAWRSEADGQVREAIAATLGDRIAGAEDEALAQQLLQADETDDAIRVEAARRAPDAKRRLMAVETIRDPSALIDLALSAGNAETRLAAAERVHDAQALDRLAEAARNKDHGVYRLARSRVDAIKTQVDRAAEADVILSDLEALAHKPGPILTEVVELNRRWQALDMNGDSARLARSLAARRAVQARLEREQEEQRTRNRLEAAVREWIDALQALNEPDSDAMLGLRNRLAELRAEAEAMPHERILVELAQGEERLQGVEQEVAARADAEALVLEAERLAAGTYIDHGDLPKRWEALDRSLRTPAFTRRFEAALIAVEQRRHAHTEIAQQEAHVARQHLHALLHTAEQALAAGQLKEARTAADELKRMRVAAGTLPKPTTQRMGRLQQQLVELERWQAFGQHNARVQLCERAEAAAQFSGDMRALAQEVQTLRNEWKALDQQYAGVPKALWERFDRACEKAYAPAARHFAEQAARRKEARRKREEFIATTADQVELLMQEPRDWRAIERWLRETDQKWREGELGSIEPKLWKELDGLLKAALSPLRSALGEAREQAKAARRALIEEVRGLASKAFERDAPSQVKAIQTRWQENAKAMPLPQRDERALWDEFRAACDAVFKLRHDKRSEADGRKQETRRALEDVAAELDRLAQASDKSDDVIRRELRDLQARWRSQAGGSDPALRGVEARYRHALAAVEALLRSRARSREAAAWDTLALKEQLCERLDALLHDEVDPDEAGRQAEAARAQWAELPKLAGACEQKINARLETVVQALGDAQAAAEHRSRSTQMASQRREDLLALELLLGLDTPPELHAERLALQVKQLRDRFKNAVSAAAQDPGERLCELCARPGVLEARDRARLQRVFAAMGRRARK